MNHTSSSKPSTRQSPSQILIHPSTPSNLKSTSSPTSRKLPIIEYDDKCNYEDDAFNLISTPILHSNKRTQYQLSLKSKPINHSTPLLNRNLIHLIFEVLGVSSEFNCMSSPSKIPHHKSSPGFEVEKSDELLSIDLNLGEESSDTSKKDNNVDYIENEECDGIVWEYNDDIDCRDLKDHNNSVEFESIHFEILENEISDFKNLGFPDISAQDSMKIVVVHDDDEDGDGDGDDDDQDDHEDKDGDDDDDLVDTAGDIDLNCKNFETRVDASHVCYKYLLYSNHI